MPWTPAAAASWMAYEPTPPVAPTMRTSPAPRPSQSSVANAVPPVIGRAAAATGSSPAGWGAGAVCGGRVLGERSVPEGVRPGRAEDLVTGGEGADDLAHGGDPADDVDAEGEGEGVRRTGAGEPPGSAAIGTRRPGHARLPIPRTRAAPWSPSPGRPRPSGPVQQLREDIDAGPLAGLDRMTAHLDTVLKSRGPAPSAT
ncbi:hypothetical protein OG723_36240 [Streptomyces sp. NBC_01278]|nr:MULTISPECIES: hypothetical protein [unclassified Streptomyces]WSR22853.1 hypothetical protein OG573_29475 [Streptomyces sp. NBC_01205]